VYQRGHSGVPGEREYKREGKMMARFRCGNEERKQVLDGRKGKKVQNVL
jgi:hypothetical protein